MTFSTTPASYGSVSYTPWPEATTQQYRTAGIWQDLSLYEHFAAAAERCPDRIAIISGNPHSLEVQLSYRQLRDQSNRLATSLLNHGLESGDCIVIQAIKTPEFFTTLFACCQIGVVPVLALPAHGAFEIEHFCQQVSAKMYFASANAKAKLPAAVSGQLTEVLIGDRSAKSAWQQYLQAEPLHTCQKVGASPVALLQVSGGTTGLPKLIPRTHNDYAYSVLQSNRRCQITASTKMLVALPVSHNFPLSSPGALGVLFAGGTVILSPSGRGGEALPLIESYRADQVALVPALLQQWLMTRGEFDTKSLSRIQVGGQRLDPSLARKAMARFDCKVQQVFGMAEGLVCYSPQHADIDSLVSAQGEPMSPYDEIRIVDDDDREVAEGRAGHLLTRGPYTIRGYYRAEEHNAASFTSDGFYRTGDIVSKQPDGQLLVCGRSKDQINRAGEKISCLEVETLVLQLSSIHYACLVPIPDKILGEKSLLFVVADASAGDAAQRIKDHLKSKGIAAFKIPDQIRMIDAMPVTAVGKIDKNALKQLAASAGTAADHSSRPAAYPPSTESSNNA